MIEPMRIITLANVLHITFSESVSIKVAKESARRLRDMLTDALDEWEDEDG